MEVLFLHRLQTVFAVFEDGLRQRRRDRVTHAPHRGEIRERTRAHNAEETRELLSETTKVDVLQRQDHGELSAEFGQFALNE
jgi:hypothetical protein